MNKKHISLLFVFFVFSLGCKAQKATSANSKSSDFSENYTQSKHFHEASKTYYYLVRIKHRDQNGKLIKLRQDIATRPDGDIAMDFAAEHHAPIAFNASMDVKKPEPGTRQTVGIQIIDGKIIQELKTRAYTLGIKDNNELVAYEPGVTAKEILKDGAKTALTGFIPLIENHKPVSEDLFKVAGNLLLKHPRQVIAQFDNLDLLVFSCGGRGIDGEGMTAKEMMDVLQGLNVKFAFNLDGGGSVSTVVDGKLITKKIDGKGTKDRPRPNFLYVLKN